MYHSRSRWFVLGILALTVMVLAACAPVAPQPGAAPAEQVELAFWNMPFVTQEVSPEYVLKWEEDVKAALPNATVDNYYGPGKYQDQRDRFCPGRERQARCDRRAARGHGGLRQSGPIEPLDERLRRGRQRHVCGKHLEPRRRRSMASPTTPTPAPWSIARTSSRNTARGADVGRLRRDRSRSRG